MLSEEQAIEKLKEIREGTIKANECGLSNNDFKEKIEVYDVILNLVKKQQEQLELIKEYAHQEIVNYTETIRDYIDDDKEGNKDYIVELKEDREHWKDIEKILQNKPKEELYMNWWGMDYMNEEEKKAIEILKTNPKTILDLIVLDEKLLDKLSEFENYSVEEVKDWACETVLNLITKLQKENEEKDKQIDLMAEIFYKRFKAELLLEYGFENEEQLKQYFADLVEKE